VDGALITIINGAPSDYISVNDRGLQYGDGVFETMLYQYGRVSLLALHLARLNTGLSTLKIELPLDCVADGLAELTQSLVFQNIKRAVVKLIVTRGSSARGYSPRYAKSPSVIFSAYPAAQHVEYARSGMDVTLCSTTVSHQAALAGIKHLNRLENVIARAEWNDEFHEGLMCSSAGNIIEGTMSNVFFVDDNKLLTPLIDRYGVAGVVRRCVIDVLAPQLGIEVKETDIPAQNLHFANSGFLTNTVIGIVPIRRLQGRTLVMPPIIEHLQHALDVYREKT
jgi:4-amino-4-deoxychorismate lyase